MGIDLSRVASSALEAALDDGDERPKRSGLRTLAAGAALAIAARAAVSKVPGLVHVPDLSALRDMPDRVRDRLADAGWIDDELGLEDEPEAEELADELGAEELEDEPEAEAQDDFDDEADEPDAEDEDEEDFDEDEEGDEEPEDEDEEDDEEPEGEEGEPAPELEIESDDDEDLHPEDRPPKPPRSKAKTR